MPTWTRLREQFADRLRAVEPLAGEGLIREDWAERNGQLRDHLLPAPPDDFLWHPAIRFQMFVDDRHLDVELPFVRSHLPAPELTREDDVGRPPTRVVDGIPTSANTIHHLHHLARFEAETDRRLRDLGTVVEWGGGYGNLAKLLLRWHGGTPTYVLVDTPVFAALQWLYLATVLGPDRVVLHDAAPVRPAAGAVNVVPCGLAGAIDGGVRADLFISTWALNESTPAAQRLVLDRRWYGARHLLLGMHHGDPLEAPVLAAGARPVDVTPTMPHQRYLIR